jgi:hypothetical protein
MRIFSVIRGVPMKNYSDFSKSSMSMHDDDKLKSLLEYAIKKENVSYIIETGTYKGLGSTKMIAEAFLNLTPPDIFITLEINWCSWRQAKHNLSRYPYILPIWGKSLPTKKALDFIKNDDALRNHHIIEDIYIDVIDDPISFYSKEIKGRLGGFPRRPDNVVRFIFDRIFNYKGENLLEHYLLKYIDRKPLVVLDSAGGTGFYEFSVLIETLHEKSFLLLLDDIHHVKHFRSANHIRKNNSFTIIGENYENGWMLAKYN